MEAAAVSGISIFALFQLLIANKLCISYTKIGSSYFALKPQCSLFMVQFLLTTKIWSLIV